ncbi:MAG: NAD(P)H-hydrate dehydratase [Candidatus Lambdaproteobacteria bacterium]|nr:NAD(P)H-hydrate dehydratase [Candidatus Lambdaproteobacteria bacterium]
MDDHAIRGLGLPGRLLMENAAQAVARRVEALLPAGGPGAIAVCCGNGNNGGDGYAVARLLANRGHAVRLIRCGTPGPGDAQENRRAWAHFGETIDSGAEGAAAEAALRGAAVIVDALFGTGLSRAVEGEPARLIAAINAAPTRLRVAVDIPSGIDADSGAVLGAAVRCSHTVSLQVGKAGCHQFPGALYAGEVEVADVSIPPRWPAEAPPTVLVTHAFARALRPARPRDGHKGTFGHVLLLCGSAGYAGAAALAGLGALKAGAGLVTLGVPRALRDRYVGIAPELITLASEAGGADAFESAHAPAFAAAAATRRAAVLGCGLGQRPQTRAFVEQLVAGLALPLVIDADGLNLLEGDRLLARPHPTILTPHPGELSRLAGLAIAELARDRIGHARRLARQWNVVLVLKGAGTVVAAPTGEAFLNPTGDEGMASGGTGDVLSGIVGALLAQGLVPVAAAVLGVYLHGLARDLSRPRLSSAAFSATDLVAHLNEAWQALEDA